MLDGPLTMGARVFSQMCSVWACGLFLKAEGFQTHLPTYLVLAALFTGLAFAPCEMCGPLGSQHYSLGGFASLSL